jgi:hypothetical protein
VLGICTIPSFTIVSIFNMFINIPQIYVFFIYLTNDGHLNIYEYEKY